MPYTIVDGFKTGMVRTITALNLPPGSVYVARNVHVTQSGELQKRADVHLLERYAAGASQNEFFGLVATKDYLYTFGSQDY